MSYVYRLELRKVFNLGLPIHQLKEAFGTRYQSNPKFKEPE